MVAVESARVYLTYARKDGQWARGLAGDLERHQVRVFLHERDLAPGDVEIHRIDELIGRTGTALLVLSAGATSDPRLLDEYAAFLREAGRRELRIIPVLCGDAAIAVPPLASTRLPVDFRGLGREDYDVRVRHLAHVICDGERPTESATPAFVVTYAREDSGYGNRLAAWLTGFGLPVWSIADLEWGSRFIEEIRRRLCDALAVIVLMSPAAEESEDVEREILEGQRHDREFFPVLLRGERNFLLASSWSFDARDGALPGFHELRRLQDIYHRRLTGAPAGPAAPVARPSGRPATRYAPPAGDTLSKLRSYLAEQELAHADILTTSLVLEAVDRTGSGWLRAGDGPRLPVQLLAAVDEVWSEYTGGSCGFRRQRQMYELGYERDFKNLALEYGWSDRRGSGPQFGERPAVERYSGFVDRAAGRPGFFPTLRNPQDERYPRWYDRWRKTVVAVHLRLRAWGG